MAVKLDHLLSVQFFFFFLFFLASGYNCIFSIVLDFVMSPPRRIRIILCLVFLRLTFLRSIRTTIVPYSYSLVVRVERTHLLPQNLARIRRDGPPNAGGSNQRAAKSFSRVISISIALPSSTRGKFFAQTEKSGSDRIPMRHGEVGLALPIAFTGIGLPGGRGTTGS